MGTGIFGIGLSGLNAARASLETTSHNISNVNTPGYHRQQNTQASRFPFQEGFGFVGRGVDTTSVSRVYDRFLERQMSVATSQNSYYSTQEALVSQVDNVVANQNTGLAPSLQEFFRGLQTLSANPTSLPARQSVLNLSQSLAGRIQSLNSRFEELRQQANGQVGSTVENINANAAQIADLNKQIQALNADSIRVPNDLLDKRDQLVLDLNKLVDASVVQQSDGTYNVFIGNGQALVASTNYNKLQAVPNADDPEQMDVAYSFQGSIIQIPNNLITGGQLGAVLSFRADSLNRAQADLGRLAISIADTVNRQHALGRDGDNLQGGNEFFKDLNVYLDGGLTTSGMMVDLDNASPERQLKQLRQAASEFAVRISAPEKIAVGSSLKSQPDDPTQSKAYFSSVWQVANARPETVAPFAGPIQLTYDAANQTFTGPAGFTVTPSKDMAGGYRVTSGATPPLVLEFKLEGTPANAQTFTIDVRGTGKTSPDAALSDNANMLAMVKLQSANTMAGTPSGGNDYVPADNASPSANFQSFYGQLVSYIGVTANSVKTSADTQAAMLKEVTLARESFSGVNLDEEAANLLRYQQAYQASSKVIQIAQSIFSDLLQLGR
ncbi:flagellar hook-associated protein FlgK [Gulbenkiania indica]|uniref:Flagellar hook-associated protein 1 n=1 Tax=Gulbenkiania indica TaxID=375574 RepID=A0A0K6H5A3_9NEIS|nr:flagellar hook-associated protein FlgK [Gulbenkiania indica]CUA86159.1 flagellar hook-associated protein FlgK [Gulbenkiania indica]